ncbi:MAG: hypothetical protein ACOYZ8_13255 [Chloroflexota bacterium]
MTNNNYPPPKIPNDLIGQFPRLGEILSTVHNPMNNLYWETWPPIQDVMKWGWTRFDLWPSISQKKFDQLWPLDGDDWVDSLIGIYGSNWHNALPFLTARDQPEFLGRLQSASETREIVISGIYKDNPAVIVDTALSHGPWVRTVKRRDWVFPSPNYCSICGTGYYIDTVRYFLLRKWGYTSVCPRCLYIASYGIPETSPLYMNFSLEDGLKNLQTLASIVQVIPPQAFRETLPNPGYDPSIRDRVLGAMICIPTASAIKELAGGVSWLKILQLSGLVGEAWRPSKGTFCIASDGHSCRSLAERSIDDWLTKQGISHQIEPHWPRDPTLNPGGRFRADWKLSDGTFVEYAGLNSEDYLLKMKKKRELASKTGLKLIVLFPEDLQRLNVVFKPWIK